eukprot:g40749.t1
MHNTNLYSKLLLCLYTAASGAATVLCVMVDLPEEGADKGSILRAVLNSKVNILLAVNLICSLLVLVATGAKDVVFGPLSFHEAKSLRESMSNFLLFRVVLVGALIEYEARELSIWFLWFALTGFLRFFLVLCRERYHSVEPVAATTRMLVRFSVMLVAVFTCNALLAFSCFALFAQRAGVSRMLLLLFENAATCIGCLKVGCKYLGALRRMTAAETTHNMGGEGDPHEMPISFRAQFLLDVLKHSLTLLHLLHIWWLAGLSLSLLDLFLFMNVKAVHTQLVRIITGFRNREMVMRVLQRYPSVGREELEQRMDACAICREHMTAAKRLPCSHVFHESCLLQWVQYRTICPVCRATLHDLQISHANNNGQNAQQQLREQLEQQHNQQEEALREANRRVAGAGAVDGVQLEGVDEAQGASPTPEQAADAVQPVGLRRRLPRGGPNAGDGVGADPAQEDGLEEEGVNLNPVDVATLRTFAGRSLFSINTRDWASWLPQISFEVVRSVRPPTQRQWVGRVPNPTGDLPSPPIVPTEPSPAPAPASAPAAGNIGSASPLSDSSPSAPQEGVPGATAGSVSVPPQPAEVDARDGDRAAGNTQHEVSHEGDQLASAPASADVSYSVETEARSLTENDVDVEELSSLAWRVHEEQQQLHAH